MVDVKNRRRVLRIGAAVAAAVLGGGLAASPVHAAPAPTERPATFGGGFTLPAGAPTPGAGFKIKNAYRVAAGVQEYACSEAGTWGTASTPSALLIRYGSPRPMYHYAGPRWRAVDGSITLGTVVPPRVPKDGTIPWLLLAADSDEASRGRELKDVTHISRVNTTGGVGPTGACTAGATQKVRYGADYVFWTAA